MVDELMPFCDRLEERQASADDNRLRLLEALTHAALGQSAEARR